MACTITGATLAAACTCGCAGAVCLGTVFTGCAPAGSLGSSTLWEVVVTVVDLVATAVLEPASVVTPRDTTGEGWAEEEVCVGLASTTSLL